MWDTRSRREHWQCSRQRGSRGSSCSSGTGERDKLSSQHACSNPKLFACGRRLPWQQQRLSWSPGYRDEGELLCTCLVMATG